MKFYTYDNAADIAKCLNCTKKKCNNCLGNFFSANEKEADFDEEESEG